jgi:hypothetical protein
MEQRGKSYDFLVNIGVCGYRIDKEPLIQITRIFSGTTKKESLVPIFFEFAKIDAILCSDMVLYSPDSLEENNLNYVDMESRAIEFVAQKVKIPRIILKVPIDKIGQETMHFDYNESLKTLQQVIDWEKLIDKLILFGTV